MLVVGESISGEVGDCGVTRKGILELVGGKLKCSGPSTNAMCFIRSRKGMK